MKKIFYIFLLICIITGCAMGCSKEPVNEIAPKELTKEQEDIVDLLSIGKQEILIFDYKTEEEYKSIEVWLEIYKDGVLIEEVSGLKAYSNEAKPLDSQLTVLINQNPNFKWIFSIAGTHKMQINGSTDVNYGLARSFGPIDEPVTIEDGKEIILYISFFYEGDIAFYDDFQIFQEQPELLEEYPYAHVVKCKFEK